MFWLFALTCLTAAVLSPDRDQMISGLVRLCTKPVYTLTNSFDPSYGGYSGAFLNMGLVALVCILLFCLPGAVVNDGAVVAFFLTVGLSARGTTNLNFSLGIPGVLLFCLITRKRPGTQANAMVFTSGVSLLFTELLFRYPGSEWHGFTLGGILLTLGAACVSGILVAMVLSWNLRWDNVMSMYTAALPVGVISILLNAVFYQIPEIPRPVVLNPENGGNSWLISNLFLAVFFLLCILLGIFGLGGSFRSYVVLLKDKRWNENDSANYGPGNVAINLGCLGLISVVYYNLVGATWDAITFGSVLCMVCTCCRGNKPSTAWPLLLGYFAAGLAADLLSYGMGTTHVLGASAPGLITGASFAVGLGPIVAHYGWKAGVVSGVMHYCLVTSVLPVIGTFCMYHGGFTAALVSLLLVPVLNHCVKMPEGAPASE